MKRFISLVLVLVMIMACMINSSAFSYMIENEFQIPVLSNPTHVSDTNLSTLDLQPLDDYEDYIDDYISKLSIDETEVIHLESLNDCQLEVPSAATLYQADTSTQIPNQAPIANPLLLRLNPEVQINGEDTVESIFFLFTRINDEVYCYDPDGDTIDMVHLLPEGYVSEKIETSNYEGYRIHIFNKGNYTFTFAFYDSFGAISPVLSTEFNIKGRANCEVIEGNLTSENQVDIHPITLDFSKIEKYHLDLLNIGGAACNVDVLDQNGRIINSVYTDNPACYQVIKRGITLSKSSDADSDIVTYELRVSRRTDDPNGDFRYQIIYGDNDQKVYFTEDVSNAIDLPYYHSIRNYSTSKEPEYMDYDELSDYGQYYRIEAIGNERVTLVCQPEKYHFKIYDAESMVLLADSASQLQHFTPAENSPINIIAGNVSFVAGHSYYIVVYNTPQMPHSGKYSIMVGEPKRYFETLKIAVPETYCIEGVPQTWTFTLQPYVGNVAYVDSAMYIMPGLDWLLSPERIHFRVKTPGKSTWDSARYGEIDYRYENLNVPLTRADGEWTFQIIPGKTGVLPSKDLRITYYFEV